MKKLLLSMLVFLLVLPMLASATVTIEAPVYDSTTADVGDMRTVSITMRSTESNGETASVNLVPSSSYLIRTTETGGTQYSSLSIPYGGTTKTFTISANTAGSYSFYIEATVSSGSSVNSYRSDTSYIEYVNPGSFTIEVDENATGTYYEGNRTGIVITVKNNLPTPQRRNVTLYFSTSGVSLSGGDPQSRIVELNGRQNKQLIWNVTLTTLSTQYASIRIGDEVQSNIFSFSKATTTATTTTTSTGDGGGGAGSAGGIGAGAAEEEEVAQKLGQTIKDIVQKFIAEKKEELKNLIDSDEKLQGGLKIALGKELSAAIKEAVAEATEKVLKEINVSKQLVIDKDENKSKLILKIKYNGSKKVKNLIVYDTVPKGFAISASGITVDAPGANVTTIEQDPVFMFTYAAFNPNTENTISYTVSGESTVDTSLISAPYIFAEEIETAAAPAVCGNGACEANENCNTCAQDCGACPVTTPEKEVDYTTIITILVIIVIVILIGGLVYYHKYATTKQPWSRLYKR